MDLQYQRPHFSPFAITTPPNASALNRKISQAFVGYAQFCEQVLRYQQEWADWVFENECAEAIEDVALVFPIAPCLHSPRSGELEVLIPRRTPVFIYTSYNGLRWFVENQCIAQDGDMVLACTMPPYVNDPSLQEMARVHNEVCAGSYTTSADMRFFVAIQLSSLFVEERTCTVRGQNALKRSCRFFRRPAGLVSRYDIVAFGSVLFHDELDQAETSDVPPHYFDLRYEYQVFLQESEAHDGIGRYPQGASPPTVAIVGGGLSGLVAATELLGAGVKDITLFESVDEIHNLGAPPVIYGDVYQSLTSFRVMPFSANQICLSYYLDKFRIPSGLCFPCAGNDHTTLYFRQKSYTWPAGETPPGIFQRVYAGWNTLVCEGFERNGRRLVAPMEISSMLKGRRHHEAGDAWRAWLTEFGHFTFYAALVEIFTGGDSPPGGEAWQTPHDFEAFGILRLGYSRVSSCYQHVLFSTILNWIINGYDHDQHLSIGGVQLLQARMRIEIFQQSQGKARLCFDSVSGIAKEEGRFKVRLKDDQSLVFDRVIIGGNAKAASVDVRRAGDETSVNCDVPRAFVYSSAVVNSTLYIVTKQKFWVKVNIPTVIWTDGPVRELYCIDMESRDGKGLVVLHYALDDNLRRRVGHHDKKRRCLELVGELSAVFPELAAHLVPVDEDYGRYVFDGYLLDNFSRTSWKLNSTEQGQYVQGLPMEITLTEKDGGVYLIDNDYCVPGASSEEYVQAGIKAACAIVRSTGGTLCPFHPLECSE